MQCRPNHWYRSWTDSEPLRKVWNFYLSQQQPQARSVCRVFWTVSFVPGWYQTGCLYNSWRWSEESCVQVVFQCKSQFGLTLVSGIKCSYQLTSRAPSVCWDGSTIQGTNGECAKMVPMQWVAENLKLSSTVRILLLLAMQEVWCATLVNFWLFFFLKTGAIPPLFVGGADNPYLLYYQDYRYSEPYNVFPLVVRDQICVGSKGYRMIPAVDEWCMTNCLRYPPNCPSDICECP